MDPMSCYLSLLLKDIELWCLAEKMYCQAHGQRHACPFLSRGFRDPEAPGAEGKAVYGV